jgi:hypothetical protein
MTTIMKTPDTVKFTKLTSLESIRLDDDPYCSKIVMEFNTETPEVKYVMSQKIQQSASWSAGLPSDQILKEVAYALYGISNDLLRYLKFYDEGHK